MAKDDYFKIVYLILKELYECKKSNERVDLDGISAKRFGINEGYLLEVFEELLEGGYVKGFLVKYSKTGKYVMSMEDIGITMKGIEYLEENSAMKKVFEVLKNIKDSTPGL